MKDSSAPESPDPRVTIPLQQQANMESFNAMLNASRANTVTPYGSMTWNKNQTFDQAGYDAAMAAWEKENGPESRVWVPGGSQTDEFGTIIGDGSGRGYWETRPGSGVPAPDRNKFMTDQWTYTTQLSPEQQKLYDANVGSQLQQADLLSGLTSRVKDATSQPLDFSGLPALTGSVNEADGGLSSNYMRGLADRSLGNNFSNEVADATYGLQTRYLDPQIQREQQALEARLAEQGFVPGTPGYTQAMQTFQDTRNRAYGQARDSAVTAGYGQANTQTALQTQLANLLSGSARANATFGNQARNQAIAELLQKRNYPLNELNALRSGTQVQQPQGQATYQTPNLATPDVIGAYNQNYQNQLGQYSANVGSNNALLGDFTTLLGTSMLPGSTGLFTGLGKLFGG